jgi:hypothetical protein
VPVVVPARLDATSPPLARAADRACLDHARATGCCVLAATRLPGDVVALGRFHQTPGGGAVWRRTTGGRVCAFGDGFVRLTLAMPHRSALVADDPAALAPEQVLNRAVRGPMAALERLGAAVLYPGRDLLTIARRPVAVLGLAVEDDGATLVDVLLSLTRDAAVLPFLLDRADPAGVVRADMIAPGTVAALGRDVDDDTLVAASARGYAERLGVRVGEAVVIAPRPTDADDAWQAARRPDPSHTHHATTPTALGVLEAHAALAPDGTLADVRLAGDVLASTATVAALEAGLRGVRPTPDAARAAVESALGASDRVLLGVDAATIAETVAAIRS